MEEESRCSQCGEVLPDDGVARKRVRARRCGQCVKRVASARRVNDPVRLLHRRFYSSARNWWPGAKSSTWSKDVVRAVMQRCEGRSVISRESNPDLLVVVTKLALTAVPPPSEQLVLVTKRESRQLRDMAPHERAACFAQIN